MDERKRDEGKSNPRHEQPIKIGAEEFWIRRAVVILALGIFDRARILDLLEQARDEDFARR